MTNYVHGVAEPLKKTLISIYAHLQKISKKYSHKILR